MSRREQAGARGSRRGAHEILSVRKCHDEARVSCLRNCMPIVGATPLWPALAVRVGRWQAAPQWEGHALTLSWKSELPPL